MNTCICFRLVLPLRVICDFKRSTGLFLFRKVKKKTQTNKKRKQKPRCISRQACREFVFKWQTISRSVINSWNMTSVKIETRRNCTTQFFMYLKFFFQNINWFTLFLLQHRQHGGISWPYYSEPFANLIKSRKLNNFAIIGLPEACN